MYSLLIIHNIKHYIIIHNIKHYIKHYIIWILSTCAFTALLLRSTAHVQVQYRYVGTRQIIMHTDLISNSALLINNFVSLLSDL